MDAGTFDQWTARFARPSRRSALRLLAAGLLGGVMGHRGASVAGAAQRLDSDGDGLYDDDETLLYGTDPFSYDSDGDAVGDGEEVYYGTNPLLGDQVVLAEPPPDASVGNGGEVAIGDVNNGGNANGAIGVGDTRDYCRAIGASCTYDTECCGPNVLCCFDGTTLTTRCTDVTVYGGVCL